MILLEAINSQNSLTISSICESLTALKHKETYLSNTHPCVNYMSVQSMNGCPGEAMNCSYLIKCENGRYAPSN